MARAMNTTSVYEPKVKRTSIGNGKVKMNSMNKSKRRDYKPYKGQGKRKIKKLPFTVKGYILYYAFFWVVIISIYLAHY